MEDELLKRKQVRIYLDPIAEGHLNALTKGVRRLSESAIVTELVSAALEACAEAGNRLPLPLKLEVIEGRPELNQSRTSYKSTTKK